MLANLWLLALITGGIVACTLVFNMSSFDRSNWVDERTGPGDLDDERWGLDRLTALAGPVDRPRIGQGKPRPRRSAHESPSRWFP
jgi:hypothetical protein